MNRREKCGRMAALACALLLVFGAPAIVFSQEPDNSTQNKDHDTATTADQQKENTSDREITRKIRKSVMEDKSLSSYAHNVKIIAQNGSVTLRGPVRSVEEKQSVAQKASEVVGKANVMNELTIAGSQPSGSQEEDNSDGR